MIKGKYHATLDEYRYPRQDLIDLYYSELEPFVVQYGAKMRWGPDKRQAWTPGINAVDPTLAEGKQWLTDYPLIKEIFDKFNITDFHPDDMDILVYNQEYEFPPHVDFKQNAVIMLPILPDEPTPITYYTVPELKLQKYTKFRSLDKEKYIDYIHNYSMEYPTLSNGMCIHGVSKIKPNETRVFLRIKLLTDTFEDIIDKLEKGVFINE